MDAIRTEQEQIEQIKKWLAENWLPVTGGLVIAFAVIFGWRGWQEYRQAQAEAASNLYTDLIIATRRQQVDKAREVAEQILTEYKVTGYAVYASLLLAKLDVDDGKTDSAIRHLQWVMDNSTQNELKHLARLRIARLLLAENRTEEALQMVGSTEPGEFGPSYEELKGDILLQQGNTKAARTAYQLALSESKNTSGNDILQMKIDSLGREN